MDQNKKPKTFLDFPFEPQQPMFPTTLPVMSSQPVRSENPDMNPIDMLLRSQRAPASSFDDMQQQMMADDVQDILDNQLLSQSMSTTTRSSRPVEPGNSVIEPAPITPPADLVSQKYKDALRKEEEGKVIENLASNFERIGRSLAGGGRVDSTPVAAKGIGALAGADRRILDAEAKRQTEEDALQATDPGSAISKMYRESLKELSNQGGFNIAIPENMSAARVKELFPQLALVIDRKLRREEISETRKSRVEARAESEKNKLDLETNRWVTTQSNKQEKLIGYKNKLNEFVERARRVKPGDRNAAQDIEALYNLIKAMDKDSAVREGELGLASKAKGLIGTLNTQLSQLTSNPRLLDNKTYDKFINTMEDLAKESTKAYDNRMRALEEQAKKRGAPLDVLRGIDPDYIPSTDRAAEPTMTSPVAEKIRSMSEEDKQKRLQELRAKYGAKR